MGRKYLSGRGNLTFLSDLDSLDLSYDLMHLGSVLQYIEDLKSELSDLFKLNGGSKPKKLFFSDSYVGSKKSFVTRGDYYGHKHPWIIRSWSDLLNDLTYFGYKLEAKAAFIPQVTGKFGFYDMSNLPKELRLTNTWHLLFKLDD